MLKKINSAVVAISWCLSVSGAGAGDDGGSFVKSSYYASGTLTASGEPFDKDGFTAASRTLPFGTRLLVTNPANNCAIIVRINDRGPYIRGRHLDLAEGAADALGMIDQGVATLKIVPLDPAAEITRL